VRRFRFGISILLFVLACSSSTLDPLPLELTISANKSTVAVGEEALFLLTARGNALAGIEVEYGDGATGSIQTFGARTARAELRHTYTSAGVYQVIARVQDGASVFLRDSTTLVVSGAVAERE